MITNRNGSVAWAVLFLTLVLALSGVSCTERNKAEKGTAEQEAEGHGHKSEEEGSVLELDQERARGVKTTKIEKRAIAETLRVPAEIRFNEKNRAIVGARVSGWIERMAIFANQAVRKDDLLAEMYSPEFLSAQQEYLLILDREKRGTADAASLVADAKNRLEILGLTAEEIEALAKSRAPYPRQHIHSPMDGVVVEHKVTPGDNVQPGQALFVVADLSSVWAEISLTETQLGQAQSGQAVTISVKTYPDRRFKGELLSVGANLDEATRTAKARALIQNPGRLLRPGMFAEAEIVLGRGEPVMALPEAAVLRNAEGKWVVYIEEEPLHFKPVEVKILRRAGNQVVIDGLAPGSQVVTEGAFFIQSELAKGSFETHNH